MSSPQLSLVVPTRNEADGISAFCAALQTALQGLDYEVWFIDDSDDGTAEILQKLASDNPEINCVARVGEDRRGGLSTAVVAGLHCCHGGFVAVMDADLQHPPQLLRQMLEHALAGADLVVASRYTTGGNSRGLDSSARHLVSRAATILSRLLFAEARATRDPLSGYFLCRRSLVDGVELRPVGFKILLELLVCVPGIQVTDVPLTFQKRTAGSSKAQAGQGFDFLRHIWSLFWHVKGSARRWKFGLVGCGGLLILLGGTEIIRATLNWDNAFAFWVPLLLSVVWNTWLNQRWTFADMRRLPGERGNPYLWRALLSAAITAAITLLLLQLGLALFAALVVAAAIAMTTNGLINWRTIHTPPRNWAALMDIELRRRLDALATQVHARRIYLIPPYAEPSWAWADMLPRVVGQRRAIYVSQTASHRVQRRIHLGTDAVILAPVIDDGEVVAIIVCESDSDQGFRTDALELVAVAAEALSPRSNLSRENSAALSASNHSTA